MKPIILFSAALVAAITLVGCGHQEGEGQEHAAQIGVTYHPKKGLLVPAETAKFIGLETVDVAERPVNAAREISGRVFRSATTNEPHALASAAVSPADAALLRPGLAGTVAFTALTATVLRLDRTQEPRNGLVEVILQVEDAARSLPDGEFVSFRFTEVSTNAVTAVPGAALFRTTEGDFVYTMSGEHFVRAAVKLGRRDGEFTEVTDGLYAGDKVVVRPVMTLWLAELQIIRGGKACADGH